MTPAEHIAEAERLLAEATDDDSFELPSIYAGSLLQALVHVGIAIAVELGAPHAAAPAEAASNG